MKICIISKYPPIEGGVSSEIYWMAKALGELNHKVYIVTNCKEVEDGYREEISKHELSRFEPKNVKVYSTEPPLPRFIPFSKSYVAKIANLAIQVIRKYNIDIIYSKYLLPYGVASLMVKQITNKPLIVGHAGSDITRLFDSAHLQSIFIEIFKTADAIVTIPRLKNKILKRCKISDDKFIFGAPSGINLREFHPDVKPFDICSHADRYKREEIPTFLYLGKVSKLKKTFEFVKACSYLKKEDFRMVFVAGDNERSLELKKYIKSLGLEKKSVFLAFQPPWRIPSLMKSATCVVSPESFEEPYLPKGTHYPKIAREAMACGKSVIIGKGMAKKGIYRSLQDGVNSYIVNPDNTKEFAQKLKMIIRNPHITLKVGIEARRFSESIEDFDKYIQEWIMAYKAVLLRHSLTIKDKF